MNNPTGRGYVRAIRQIKAKLPEMHNTLDSVMLGDSLQYNPAKLDVAMQQIFSSRAYYANNPLLQTLNELNAVKTITSNTYEWKLQGAQTRPLTIIENVIDTTNKYPGRGHAEFNIKLDENWFVQGDVLHPGDQAKQCRIMRDPVRSGNGWIYPVKLVTTDPNDFVPQRYFTVGTPWVKLYSTYGEADTQSGSTQFASDISFSGKIGKLRKKFKITDYAAEQYYEVELMGTDGKIYNKLIPFAEMKYWKDWQFEQEKALWYNRLGKGIKNESNYDVDSFAGIQEQLEESLTYYYTHFTAQLLTEYMMDCYYGRVEPGPTRYMKAYTGEYGMLLFHNAMVSELAKTQNGAWSRVAGNWDLSTAKPVSSPLHQNAYSYGYQFVQYRMYNGAILEVVHNPLYDNLTINTERDEVTGMPIESMRFTFLDFTNDMGNNIVRIEKENGYKFAYINGLISPTGPAKGTASHAGEFYTIHASKEFGIQIIDPTRCGEFILKRA